ncbi:MAG TPA: GNAT family protein [Candidatus Nitrosocosmicus sp.]|nr:GNAT family protein [Candidatus Nitrosocosmicus sp.]
MLDINEITLEHSHIVLRPPRYDDLNGLCSAATDGEIWKNPYSSFPSIEEMSIYLQDLIKHDNSTLPFIIVDRNLKTIVGTTRFFNIDHQNYRVEIGHTWIAKSYRRSPVNTEAKFLMLRHAFEKLNCIAVEIRTDVLNHVSRKAIERIGGKQDGILRNHRIMRNGRIRDTACYSIIQEEWPKVKENLLNKMKY